MSYELDEDIALERTAEHTYRGNVTDRWSIGTVPNGGYLMCLAQAGVLRSMPSPDPLTLTAHFLRPGTPGPVEVRVEPIKTGKRHATAAATLVQDGRELLRMLATLGDLTDRTGPEHVAGAPPPLPAPEDCTRPQSLLSSSFGDRFEQRYDPETAGAFRGARSERAEFRAHVRFADGRPPDVTALALVADCMPPPVFHVVAPGWTPTMELTVHVRARPSPGWLRCAFRTRFLFGGYLEEDGEIWDESGQLVALSRQLASMPRS